MTLFDKLFNRSPRVVLPDVSNARIALNVPPNSLLLPPETGRAITFQPWSSYQTPVAPNVNGYLLGTGQVFLDMGVQNIVIVTNNTDSLLYLADNRLTTNDILNFADAIIPPFAQGQLTSRSGTIGYAAKVYGCNVFRIRYGGGYGPNRSGSNIVAMQPYSSALAYSTVSPQRRAYDTYDMLYQVLTAVNASTLNVTWLFPGTFQSGVITTNAVNCDGYNTLNGVVSIGYVPGNTTAGMTVQPVYVSNVGGGQTVSVGSPINVAQPTAGTPTQTSTFSLPVGTGTNVYFVCTIAGGTNAVQFNAFNVNLS